MAERLHDVAAATDATVHQDLDAVADRLHDLRERAQRGGDAVELAPPVIGDDHGRRAGVDRAAGVVARQHPFHHDRAVPGVPQPPQVLPGHGGAGKGRGDVHEGHGPFTGKHDIGKRWDAPTQQERREPTGVCEQLRQKRQSGPQGAAQQLRRAVADVALPQSRHGGIDGDDERRKARYPGAVDRRFRGGAPAQQIQLIPYGTGAGRLHVLERVPRHGGEDVARAGRAGGAGGGGLSGNMHHAAVSHGSEQHGDGELPAEHGGAQVDAGDADGVSRPERHGVEGVAVLPQRDFTFSAAVQVVEHHSGEAATGQLPQVLDVHDAGRGDGTGGAGHSA